MVLEHGEAAGRPKLAIWTPPQQPGQQLLDMIPCGQIVFVTSTARYYSMWPNCFCSMSCCVVFTNDRRLAVSLTLRSIKSGDATTTSSG